MSSLRVQLQEYGDFVAIPPESFNALDIEIANLRWQRMLDLPQAPFQLDTNAGVQRLRAVGVTGVIRVGQADLEIVPKFLGSGHPKWRSAFWKILLSASKSIHDELPTQASPGRDNSFIEFLADLFISSYFTGSARGLPRTYHTVKNKGFVLKGSFDAGRAMDFLVEPWRVPYLADVLSEDTQLARLLRWAAARLKGLVSSSNRGRLLHNILDDLSHVGRLPPHLIDARKIHLGAQHRGLEMALDIGILLLEGSGLAHENGNLELPGFLWRSSTVYEEFVYSVCQEVAADHGLSVSKANYPFGEVVSGIGTRLLTIPDIVFRDKFGATKAVADAKYKQFNASGRPVPSDTYQMITGGHVLGCSHVSLIYPFGEHRERTTWRLESKLGGDDIFLSALHINPMDILYDQGRKSVGEPISKWLADSCRG